MRTVNIHDAKTHLSRLIEETLEHGEGFVIAKAGRPVVRVIPVTAPETPQIRRLGFLAGHIEVPDDFDAIGQSDIADLFAGEA
ncbi:type II toxin-antitoxin system Phd/YefM family antitoxin [Acidisoma silvae]|uniref:Antitoxin n=1 Tax=Acidisoma silvae TaxID=2802396 RepID=A0A963YSX6_9PROT|nr:type II toxin-antitoxin system prevent-host-death family antitoxin [Acidisoma silvae]MCB8876341.1 type II toxin-antitoxin system prevent-host-death family antitoxin [Acidisoma silvae]